jgi:hypothetical protein
MKLKVSEKQEQAAIVQLLKNIGAKVYVLGTRRPAGDHQGTRQTPGIPDVFAFLPRRENYQALWIEVKRVGGRASTAQADFASQCHYSDVCYIRGTCDDVIKWLKIGGWVK